MITLKAHSLEPALPQLAPLVGPRTTIVSAVNGVPWWYTYGLPAPFSGPPGHLGGPGRRAVRRRCRPRNASAHRLPGRHRPRARRDRAHLW